MHILRPKDKQLTRNQSRILEDMTVVILSHDDVFNGNGGNTRGLSVDLLLVPKEFKETFHEYKIAPIVIECLRFTKGEIKYY